MKHLELFEPDLNAVENYEMDRMGQLALVAAIFEAVAPLEEVKYSRYNLTADPEIFAKNTELSTLLNEKGNEALPVTMVDGIIMKSGDYPTVEEFGKFTDLMFVQQEEGCCGGHGHHHGHGECCCGGHGHHHGNGEGCCSEHGGHHHGEGEGCCGGHGEHQHEQKEDCCCEHQHNHG